MWILGLSVVAVIVIYLFHWIMMLNNPKVRNRALPPGSMGFPFIGETLHLMINPGCSLDVHPFIKKRIQRFGPIFRTSLCGQPVVISSDPEFNNYLVQQEGRLVEIWVGPLAKVFPPEKMDLLVKSFRSIILRHVGADYMREKLLPQLEELIRENLANWSTQAAVEVKQSSSDMAFHFFSKQYFGYDARKVPETGRIAERLFSKFEEGLLTIPLDIPGTTYHKFLEEAKKAFTVVKNILEERRNSPENYRGDFLQAIHDMAVENKLTDDQTVYIILGTWFATCVSLSSIVTLIFKFLSEHPSVIQEIRVEHEEILKCRDEKSSSVTWEEYKSMKFTQQVINEALRFSILIPGLLRTALKDIHVKDYTIPTGWTILAVTPVLHLNSEIYKDPLTFNPSRWKELDSYTVSKNFKPFGGGSRQCPGAELTRAFTATFLHVLVTKYRWTKIKGGSVVRNPILGFGDGIHIKIWEKDN